MFAGCQFLARVVIGTRAELSRTCKQKNCTFTINYHYQILGDVTRGWGEQVGWWTGACPCKHAQNIPVTKNETASAATTLHEEFHDADSWLTSWLSFSSPKKTPCILRNLTVVNRSHLRVLPWAR
jgi:hypothetical protein